MNLIKHKSNNIKIKNRERYTLSVLLLFCVFACFFSGTRIKGDDMSFHAQRIAALAYEFSNNGMSNFPIRIYNSTLGGYGYASPLFYGDIFLYIPAMAVAFLGVNTINALQVTVTCIIIATLLSAYYASRSIGFSKNTALLVSTFYAFSPYLLTDYYKRCAVGEAIAAAIIPIALMSFYKIKERKYIFVLAFSMVFMLLSHLITTLVVTVIFFVCVIIKLVKYCLTNHDFDSILIRNLCFAAIIAVGVSAFFLFPLLEQMHMSNGMNAFSGSGKSPSDNLLTFKSLFITRWFESVLYCYVNKLFGTNLSEGELYTVGAVIYPLIGILITFLFNKKIRKNIQNLLIIVIGLLFVMMSNSIWRISILSVIQFPWRLLVFYTLTVCVISGILLDNNELSVRYKKLIKMTFVIGMLVYMLPMLCKALISTPLSELEIYTTYSIGLDDYLFNGYTSEDIEERGCVIIGSELGQIYDFERNSDSLIVSYEDSVGETIELPLTMIYGYTAHDIDTGAEISLSTSEMGLIQLQLPKNGAGTIMVQYTGTIVQRISNVITLVTLALLLVYGLFSVLAALNVAKTPF